MNQNQIPSWEMAVFGADDVVAEDAAAGAALEAGASAALEVLDVDELLQAVASNIRPTAGAITATCIFRIVSPLLGMRSYSGLSGLAIAPAGRDPHG